MILEVFYDANCPFCVKRAEWIRKNDVDKDILLSDVNRDLFMLELFGVRSEDALQDVHAVYRNGEVIKGPQVVRAVLNILGYRRLLRLINFPGVRLIFNLLYDIVSKNRHRIGW
jgi:predicted DCC family thiol-disulfide oxidoreductase YuxK